MNRFELTLDLDKRGGMAQWVTLRQGDHNGTELRATIYDHGTQAGGGYTCRVSIRLPGAGDEYYRETATYTNGVAVVTVDEEYAAAIVGVTEGYFELLQGDAVIASTESFGVRILRSAQDGAVPGDKYDSAIEDALAELDEATGRISQMVVDATEEYLEAHPELTTTVEDNSLTDAKLIQHGGILDRVARLWHRLDNLLTATPAEADALTVTDAAKTPLAGLALYGRSTQDGTPTPSAPVPIESVTPNLWRETVYSVGQTWTAVVSITKADYNRYIINGTSTGTHWLWGGGNSLDERLFVTLPAGTYTAVLGGNGAANCYIAVRGRGNGALTQIATGASPLPFTLTEETPVEAVIVTYNGRTFSNSEVSIQLYEGSSATPVFVPYDNIGLWARGRNLLPRQCSTQTINGVTFTVNADGSVHAQGTASANAVFYYTPDTTLVGSLPVGTLTFSGCPAGGGASTWKLDFRYQTTPSPSGGSFVTDYGGGATFTRTQVTYINITRIVVYSGVTINATFRPQINLGSTATAYQPYAESVTPIDLDGHVLRSLPDGTRDEVSVDQYGNATLIQRVGHVVLTGATEEGWSYNTTTSRVYTSTNFGAVSYINTGTHAGGARSDRYQLLASGGTAVTGNVGFEFGSSALFVKDATNAPNLNDWKSFLAANPVTMDFMLATPVTIDLGTVDAIALQGPDMTAQAVPTAPFALTYERDLNVTLARLEAAIADAATA